MVARVRAAGLQGYIEAAQEIGIDGFAMLRQRNIGTHYLRDPEARVAGEPIIALIEETARQAGRGDFALSLVERRSFASIGSISLLLQHLETPLEVVEALVACRHAIADVYAIDHQRRGGLHAVALQVLSASAGPQAICYSVAMTHRILAECGGGEWQAESVHFVQARPAEFRRFEAFFGTRVEFGSDFDGFLCSPEAMAIRNRAASAEMAANARRLLGEIQLPLVKDSVTLQARYAIATLIGQGQPTIAAVAANLGTSVRALQRALEDEGSRFGDLLHDTRRQLALRYLRGSSLPISGIAEMVGYASASSFSRWFTSEFGESPIAFRARQPGAPRG